MNRAAFPPAYALLIAFTLAYFALALLEALAR